MSQAPSSILNQSESQCLSRVTLYGIAHSSHDFEDVKAALNERMNWSIELFRSCFAIRLSNGGHLFTLCSLSFLAMAESMYMDYGRLTPKELKERADKMGHITFAAIFAVLDLGVIIVRIASIYALSMPALATGLVFVTMIPSLIPLLLSLIAILKSKMDRKPAGEEAEIESDDVVGEAGC